MHIAVIGAGIVGLTTAYELASDGHTVSLYERHSAVAMEASFACAGHLSPSLIHPWAFPPQPEGSWWSRLWRTSGIALRPGLTSADLRWLADWKFGHPNFLEARTYALALNDYSLGQHRRVAASAVPELETAQGMLALWPSPEALQRHAAQWAPLKAQGLAMQVLDAAQARAIEPALQEDFAFAGASYFPQDAVGNCRQFAHFVKDRLADQGVTLHYGTALLPLGKQPGAPTLQTADGKHYAVDQVVVCAGMASRALLAGLQHLPLTALTSYSLSVPIRESLHAPRSSVMDMRSGYAISRIGNRVRVSGGAELGRAHHGPRDRTVKQLYQTLNTLFPGAANYGRNAQVWQAATPHTPDGLPLVGPSSHPGIWLNTGHGHSGWSQACGTARMLADLVAGQAPAIASEPLLPERFARR